MSENGLYHVVPLYPENDNLTRDNDVSALEFGVLYFQTFFRQTHAWTCILGLFFIQFWWVELQNWEWIRDVGRP